MGNCASQSSSQISANASPTRTVTTDSRRRGTGVSRSSSLNATRRQSIARTHPNQPNGTGNGTRTSNEFSDSRNGDNSSKNSLSSEERLKWKRILDTQKDLIVDPMDVHTVLDTSISQCINQLQSAETTLILRRVRKVVSTYVKNSNQKTSSLVYGYGNGKKKVPLDDVAWSKSVYQKYNLLDMNLFRVIFIAGERWLMRGRQEGWMQKSLELYLTRKEFTQNRHKKTNESQGHGEKVKRHHLPASATTATEHDKKRAGNNHNIPLSSKAGIPGDIIGAAYTLLLYYSESRWDYIQTIAVSSAEQAGLVLDANKSLKQNGTKSEGDTLPSPPPLSPYDEGEENGFSPEIPDGVTFKDLTYLIAFSLRCSRQQRLHLLFHLLIGSDKLRDILEIHPAGGIPSWIMEFDHNWRLSYASLGHDYYFKESIRVDARVAIETIGILLHNTPPQDKDMADNIDKTSAINRKRALSHGDRQYHEAKMHVMLSDYLRSVRTGGETPVFENEEEQRKRNRLLETFWDASHDIYSNLQLLNCTSKIGHDSSEILSWSFEEFMTWADLAIPGDFALDNIMHQAFGMGLLPTPAMERQLVADSWVEWQTKEIHLWGGKAEHDYAGSILAVTNSIRNLLNFPNRENGINPEESPSPTKNEDDFHIRRNHVWGGIGGFDGRGGLGEGIMYCIDKQWWFNWMAYVGWYWNSGSHEFKSRSRIRPSHLSTENLLNQSSDAVIRGSMGSFEIMKEGIQKDLDYVLIPPPVWDILYELYAGGPPLPRMLTKRPFQNSHLDVSELEKLEIPMKIPRSISVVTHPWIIECQVCDPHQPYRRGDLGPMSIRLMATPNESLWRLFAEIVLRLPIVHPRGSDSEGKGRGRLWTHIDQDNKECENSMQTRYGPWQLLMKEDAAAAFPTGDIAEIDKATYDDFVRGWDEYVDRATVESIGLKDGSRLMFEYALVGRDGKFTWPREAAAKAGVRQRDSAEDIEFRRMLRGMDSEGNYVEDAKQIVGTVVDAMDSAGRWYQAEIVDIDQYENTNTDSETCDDSGNKIEGCCENEIRAVKIDFRDIGGHEEWILVLSDRLAVKGRFTQDSMKSIRLELDTNGGKQANAESKSRSLILKRHSSKEPTSFQLTTSVCSFPGFGACGLTNLGNTCYANSAIQCISYMPLLRSYLVSGHFKRNGDINKDNPLGTGGKLFEEFAFLQKLMWSAKLGVRTPTKFRAQLARVFQQYSGADQQDAQELLNDLLDALHEDSNKVVKKPYVEALDDEWVENNHLSRVGEESWRRFLRRNRSIIANIGMGQVLNRVTCPICKYTSHNFDPFNMLSVPFPTVSDVVFKCKVFRRATPYNCPGTLGLKMDKQKPRHSRVPAPPSERLIMEEYLITMSRLADVSDLKSKIHKLSGIALHRLRLFVLNEPLSTSPMNLCAIPDKEGPCLQFARQGLNGGFLSPSEIPTTLIVFETTLNNRFRDGEFNDGRHNPYHDIPLSKSDAYESAKKDLEVYGYNLECKLYDTNPTVIARAMSYSLWPASPDEIPIGLRVDAIDQRGHWFAGSVVEVRVIDEGEGVEVNPNDKVQVKIHFDNFSAKWDLNYSFSDFLKGNVRPIYSHSRPKELPLEFQVFHSSENDSDNSMNCPFLLQFYSEWSEARAAAHILSQASRYIEGSRKGILIASRDAEMNKIYREYQHATAESIDALIDLDREFVNAVVTNGFSDASGVNNDKAEIVRKAEEKLLILLPKLPFRISVIKQLSRNDADNYLDFNYRLDRNIGNVMNAQMGFVLKWKSISSSDPKLLCIPPQVNYYESSEESSPAKKNNEPFENAKYSHGGMSLGVCLDEFCKEQKLEHSDNWKCPKCKDVREGNQHMTLWRLPDLLTFHLKRFNCSARWREKITTKINFPLTGLDMKKWCDENSPCCSNNYVYDLIGVVNHYGGMTGGHYVATCKVTACSPEGSEEVEHNFNGAGVHAFGTKEAVSNAGWKLGRNKEKDSLQSRAALGAAKVATESSEPLWLQFDDDSVEPIPPRIVNDESAYVLFYRRRQISPANISK